jgi:CRP-like cAMP-binding protein
VTPYPTPRRPGNRILQQLTGQDSGELISYAEYVTFPVGHTMARVADPFSTMYFPDAGVISLVSEMRTGHHLAVAAIGAEGVAGLGALFGKQRHTLSLVVLVETAGHSVPATRFGDLFHRSDDFRRVVLAHVGCHVWELMTAAACNRVHSHRQRLARWLLTTADKARRQSLALTHETLAQMVGGPRHAVTVALNDLRAKGAIAHLRGRIDVLDRTILAAQACECYETSQRTDWYGQRP